MPKKRWPVFALTFLKFILLLKLFINVLFFFLNFRVDEDENKAYRSLKILQPTLAMAGNYRCKVSTFEDEGYVEQTLSIYGKQIIAIPEFPNFVQKFHIR